MTATSMELHDIHRVEERRGVGGVAGDRHVPLTPVRWAPVDHNVILPSAAASAMSLRKWLPAN